MVKKSSYLLLLLLMSSIASSCRSKVEDSMLILAFENLNSMENLCSREPGPYLKSGLQEICGESIRFTHVYASSTLSLPNMATLLTGQYPHQHQVHHQGSPGLRAEKETLPEKALRQGFKTSFFSGGAPFLYKSGLAQGFENFNDRLPTYPKIFRPFKETLAETSDWIKSESANSPFLSFVYAPDLILYSQETVGDSRNQSYEHQLDEIDQALYDFIDGLKKTGRWDQTTVFLVGLNGLSSSDRLPQSLNMHSENLQVSLYVKPIYPDKVPHSPRTFDATISLADVGRTMEDILLHTPAPPQDPLFPVTSLAENIKSTSSSWPQERLIPIESAWAEWNKIGSTKAGAILGQQIFLYEEPARLYNTLLDRPETNPLVVKNLDDPRIAEFVKALSERNYLPWISDKNEFAQFSFTSKENWISPERKKSLLEDMIKLLSQKDFKNRSLIENWALYLALDLKNYKAVEKIILKKPVPLWMDNNNSCLRLIKMKDITAEDKKKCPSKLFLSWLDWETTGSKNLQDLMKSNFFRRYSNQQQRRQIQKMNWGLGLHFFDLKNSYLELNEVDALLSWPENSRIKLLLNKALEQLNSKSHDEEFEIFE